MSDLEKYLTGEFTRDRRDITDIEKLLCDASAIYEINCHPKFAWVYRLPSDGKDQSRLSQSTTTMILGALQCYLGHFNDEAARKLGNESKANFLNIGQISNRVALDVNINLAAIALLKETLKKSPGNNSVETKSGTFGKDDIFTLAWLAEVSQANWNRFGKDLSDDWVSVGKAVQVAIEKKLNDWRASADFSPKVLFDPSTGDLEAAKPLAHSFPVLRLVQAIRRLAGAPFGAMQVEYRYFERVLHEQLSFSSIPDSRFDPAELMFCLEGMLLCQRNVVDRTLFDRVIEVLTEVQDESAYWRPVKPYLATQQGLVLQPISVEVANSLLRSCAIFDGGQLHDTYGSKCISLFRRYWQWLKAREVRLPNVGSGTCQ